MKIDLNGQSAWVTGAGRGIGRAVAQKLAANGARVACADIDLAAARATAAELPGAFALGMDITDQAQIEAAAAEITRECGRLDILVNNAAVSSAHRVNVDEFPPEEWERLVRVDLTGVFLVSRTAAALMVGHKFGRIINIASVLGVVPARQQSAYATAKAGVVNLTRTMAIELASKGVLVNCVAPGSMESNYRDGTPLLEYGQHPLSHVPLGRRGLVEDAAHAVLFFAAPESCYITGQTLCVDGGWTAGGFFRDF